MEKRPPVTVIVFAAASKGLCEILHSTQYGAKPAPCLWSKACSIPMDSVLATLVELSVSHTIFHRWHDRTRIAMIFLKLVPKSRGWSRRADFSPGVSDRC